MMAENSWGHRLVTLCVTVLVASGCETSDSPAAPDAPVGPIAAVVSLSEEDAVLPAIGETLQIIATVFDRDGGVMPGAAVAWASDDPSIASVSASGVVTAVAPGFIRIVATSGTITGEAFVRVRVALIGEVETLASGLEYPTGLWMHADQMYITENAAQGTSFGGAERLVRYDLIAEELSTLVDPVQADAVVVSSNGTIYLGSFDTRLPGESGRISRVDPDTFVRSTVLDFGAAVVDLYLSDNDDIYVGGASRALDASSVTRLPDGDYGNPVVLAEGIGPIISLTRSGTDTYYSMWGSRSIWHLPEGGAPAELVTDVGGVWSLAVAGTHLYFGDTTNGRIGRIDLSDATPTVEEVGVGIASPLGVYWDDVTSTLYYVASCEAAREFRDGTLNAITGLD